MAKDLRERKDDLRKVWEKCFEMPINEVLNVQGINKFWSSETSFEEAGEMLDIAAISVVAHSMPSFMAVVSVGKSKGMAEEEAECTKEQFQVYNKRDRFYYDNVFTSLEDAQTFKEQEALTTSYKVDELQVVRVYD